MHVSTKFNSSFKVLHLALIIFIIHCNDLRFYEPVQVTVQARFRPESVVIPPAIAHDGSNFSLLWVEQHKNKAVFRFQRVSRQPGRNNGPYQIVLNGVAAGPNSLIWNREAGEYGLVWIDVKSKNVYFLRLNVHGKINHNPIRLNKPSHSAYWVPKILWGGDSYSVAWVRSNGSGQQALVLSQIDKTGKFLSRTAVVTDSIRGTFHNFSICRGWQGISIVWQGTPDTQGRKPIIYRRFGGGRSSSEIIVREDSFGYPAIACTDRGYIISWRGVDGNIRMIRTSDIGKAVIKEKAFVVTHGLFYGQHAATKDNIAFTFIRKSKTHGTKQVYYRNFEIKTNSFSRIRIVSNNIGGVLSPSIASYGKDLMLAWYGRQDRTVDTSNLELYYSLSE